MCTKTSAFMEKAIEQSATCLDKDTGGPFGALIVKNDQIVGVGHNKVTTDNDPTGHAEVTAIRDACKNLGHYNLEGCDIYTSCEPCPMCLGAIYWARISRIFYAANRSDAANIGFDDQRFYDEIAKPLNEREVPMTECNREQALEVFKAWNEKENKIPY